MNTFEKDQSRLGERGNVLFLILIAVALFAALSYAVTQSTRSSGGDAGKETNKISSAQLTQYPASVRTSIVRMIIGGQDVDTLEFNAPEDFTNCTESPPGSNRFPRCVFHPTGGGATHVTAPGSLMTNGNPGGWIFNGDNEIENVGTTTTAGVASGTVDLIAFLPGVSQGVCESINEELGISTTQGDIQEDSIEYLSSSNMTNPNGATTTSLAAGGASIGETSTALVGQPFGCFYDSNGNADNGGAAQYIYYHVLVER